MTISWTEELVDLVRQLLAEGKSATKIALKIYEEKHILVTRNAVIGMKKRHGLTCSSDHGKSVPKRKPVKERKIQVQKKVPPNYSPKRPQVHLPPDQLAAFRSEFDNAIPVEQRKTLLELTDRTCKWPVGQPGSADFFFCGGQAEEISPYCRDHAARAFTPKG